MLTLFPDEKIVTQFAERTVTLTTHRICYENNEWGRSYNQSIMLEHITSCENYYRTQVWLLILGGLCLIVIFGNSDNGNRDVVNAAGLAAALCGFFYWITRRNSIIISSPSTKMKIKVTGIQKEKVLNFINSVEQTKHKRILALNNRPNITG